MSEMQMQMPRRNFLKQTGGAMVGALGIEQMAHGAAGSNEIKVALVGCGGRGAGAANHGLNVGADVKLVAMCDLQPEVAQTAREILVKEHPEQVDVPNDRMYYGFDGYKKAIADADVVFLATSPGFRPLMFEEAVRQGKHVFMEKPVATCADGVRRVLAAAEEAKAKNLKVAVGMQRRHHAAYEETVKRVHDGAIGDIQYMRVYWNGSWRGGKEKLPDETELQYQIRNWYYFTWLSGDHIVEQHVHNLDVAHWLKGELPVSAQGQGGREVRKDKINGQIFDHHFVEFEYADGARLFSQSCQMPGHCRRMVDEHVVGTLGRADMANGGRLFQITGANPWEQRLKSKVDAHQDEHYPFFDAIRNDDPYAEAQYGAESTMMAILGRMATYSGKVVTWDEAMAMENKLVPDNLTNFDSEPPVLPDAEGWYPTAVPGVSEPW
jgi:myo-inositol 2-dehydrogenase/D-chiro-inositol 1-dehydrogenase